MNRMRVLVGAATLLLLAACQKQPSSLYDPDSPDAWSAWTDTVTSPMGDPPKVTSRMQTWGVLTRGDAGHELLLDAHCDASGPKVWLLPGTFVERDSEVRVRVDSLPAEAMAAMTFNTSTDGVVSFSAPMSVLRRLARGQKALIEFTDDGGITRIAQFNVRGLNGRLTTFERVCDELGSRR